MRDHKPLEPAQPLGGAFRIFGALFGLIPLGIGITVLIFLWGAPFDEFGSPPLFFRVFGSFIASAFVLGGIAIIFGISKAGEIGSTLGKTAERHSQQVSRQGAPPASAGSYVCPNCGAPLAKNADVSPLGDAKCISCGGWFNIHGRTR